ncbi:heme lyase CcmF/NrfE family subunit [Halovulum sp. GXIMD14793]
MIAELGHLAIFLAFAVACIQSVVPLIGAQKGWQGWMRIAMPAAGLQLVLSALAFGALIYAFVVSDFSLRLVVENSHSAKPMLYKVSGTWGNHEGSLLLWVLILAVFGASVAFMGNNLPLPLKARVLAVQGAIAVAFNALMLFTSNPFLRLDRAPTDGTDLNPLLQDPGLAFHPPFLYLGYVGLSMAFSFAVAALIEGRIDAAWARWVRPWTLAAWIFLTIGIGLGSWWAYYELSWGGWWFWDPVENASFMPWLVAVALLHSAIVVEKRETLKSWTILLAILGFSFSLVGTFIVRSGIITSVHAFASDPTRGMAILVILAVFIGGALTLFAIRASAMRTNTVFGLVSRESGLVINNLLLIVSAFVVFVGTLWPLIAELAFGQKLSVGPPFFDVTFTPFMVAIAVVLPIGAMLPWKRARPGAVLRQLAPALILALAVGALVWSMETGRSALAPIGAVLAVWICAGTVTDLAQRIRLERSSVSEALRRAINLPRADWGKMVAHGGLGVLFFAIAAITAWEVEDIRVLQPGEKFTLGQHELRLDKVENIRGPNYTAERGTLTLWSGRTERGQLTTERRFYPVAQMPTTEAGIDRSFTRDVYVVIGDAQPGGGRAVRTFIKPFANWLWAGMLIMAFGGILSLTDRRYRLGAPARRKAPIAVPAE